MVQEIGLVLVNEKKIQELEMLLALYYSAIALKRRGMLSSAEYTEAEWEEDLDELQTRAEQLLGLDEATIAAAFGEEEEKGNA